MAIVVATLAAHGVLANPAAPDGVDVIPRPAQVELRSGVFLLQTGTPISIPRDARVGAIARYFADLVRTTRQTRLAVPVPGAETRDGIIFRIDPVAAASDPESYTIDVSPDRILLAARGPRGLLYAAVTLWQLCTSDPDRPGAIRIPALRIADAPRFRWRGLLLDSARHFQSPAFILRLIDWMALHKLNVLQWHLSDDQGWRLQIRKYPRLTNVGAWRVPAGAAAADLDPGTGRPRLYGGFYSQATVRRIVAHAAERNITIVPEIDMPGHATAAIVAYPRLGTEPAPAAVPSDWGVYPNLFNVESATFNFLRSVLEEVIELFPGPFIHLGGDEAVKDQWHASARVQARMRALGLRDERALQSYFIERMGTFVREHGRRVVGWDEVLEGGAPPSVVVMSWRGIDGAIVAARSGHDTILTPSPTLYLDHRQGDLPDEPPGRAAIVSLEQVYRFDPMPAALSAPERRHVAGVQANIWTEHIRTEERIAAMTFPRVAALAETGWSDAGRLDWQDFLTRLPAQMKRYRLLGLHASQDAFAVRIDSRISGSGARAQIQLANQTGFGQIHYTLDGSPPEAASLLYSGPIEVPTLGRIRAASYSAQQPLSAASEAGLDADSLRLRHSRQLRPCTDKLLLAVEDDAPIRAERAIFLLDLLAPCWIYEAAELTSISRLSAGVGQVPFNFQIGADAQAIRLAPPRTPEGELEVFIDHCEGDRIASLPLKPAIGNPAVTALPAVPIGHWAGAHDLCFRFTQRAVDPMWAIDWVQLLP